jgi:type II secretory pathway component PulJ
VLVLALLAASYASSMRAYLQQKQHLEALRADIAESRQNIAALKREKRRWQDPAFIEAQATQHLSWVMPGEISFQVIDENGTPLDHEDSLSDPADTSAQHRPAWWHTAWRTVEAAGNPKEAPAPVQKIKPPKQRKP